jgi:nicotinamide mononucleotide transporter
MLFYDCLGAVLSLLATYYFVRIERKAWTFSIAASTINSWLYLSSGIYADMCLELFYVLTACYGYYKWATPSFRTETHVLVLSLKHWIYLITCGVLFYSFIYYVLTHFTSSKIPEMDALTTSLSLMAQRLMCYKVIATWVLWFVTDALYTVIYWRKGLPFHTVLMFIYMVIAVIGYISWVKRPKQMMLSVPTR